MNPESDNSLPLNEGGEAKPSAPHPRRRSTDDVPNNDIAQIKKLYDTRITIGYYLAGGTIVFLLLLSIYSLCAIHSIGSDASERVFWIRVGGHALVTLALIWLAYQLLKAAERLMLPPFLAESNPEAAKVLLGIKDLTGPVTKVLGTVVDAATKMR